MTLHPPSNEDANSMKADFVTTAQELCEMRERYYIENVEPTLRRIFSTARNFARDGRSSICMSLDGHTFVEIKTIEKFLQKQGLNTQLQSHCAMEISW